MRVTLDNILPKYIELEIRGAFGGLTPDEQAEYTGLREMLTQFSAEIEETDDYDRYPRSLTDESAMEIEAVEAQERREGKRAPATPAW